MEDINEAGLEVGKLKSKINAKDVIHQLKMIVINVKKDMNYLINNVDQLLEIIIN